MKTSAILLAGGGGLRFGGATPKQFLDILGKPVISFALQAFLSVDECDEIVIVCHADWLDFTRALVKKLAPDRNIVVLAGGATRQASSFVGLEWLESLGGRERVLIHDSVRPLITANVIREAIQRIDETGVVDVVAKTTDTIVRSEGGHIAEIPERASLYNGQTPQGFRLEVALEAHRRALADGITNASDDVQLALRLGYRPVIVDGGASNMKITHADDLDVVRLFLERKVGVSRVVRLARPFEFELTSLPSFPSHQKLSVRPLVGSICAADVRYFAGQRSPEVLASKLPMALLHEGVAEVIHSPVPEFPRGSRVVVVPNLKRCEEASCAACADPAIGENYCVKNAFMSSGIDGLSQSLLELSPDNAVLVPEEVETDVAVMAEVLSIGVGALRRIQIESTDSVCVVGPGPVGYAAQIMIAEILQRDVAMIGRGDAMPAANIYFEAVGGNASEAAIDAIIAAAHPGATIVLLGVSEKRIAVNTRDILQKGIRLIGCSRSTPLDFARTVHFLRRPGLAAKVKRLLAARRFGIGEITQAFEYAMQKTEWGKVLIDLKFEEPA